MIYRFTQTWVQVDDVEADSLDEARGMIRGFTLDTTRIEHVDVELVGEVDEDGTAHPVGQAYLRLVK